MKNHLLLLSKSSYIQLFLYLFVNGLFILKYLPRSGVNSTFSLAFYLVLVFGIVLVYRIYFHRISEKAFKLAYRILLIIMILAIIGLLFKIDRYSVRVDRWSAVTFFLDNLFQGKYPYLAHTHVSTTNFASPFPLWHFINIPFYLMGDVGFGLIFFLLLTAYIIQVFFSDYRKSFFFLLMLFLAPSYWWEVAVRSDSLSNALVVFSFILWFQKRNYSLANQFWLGVLACGLIATTRLSAILPIALFFFKPYFQLSVKQKIIFPLAVIGIIIIFFLPFVFWDATSWIFFSRNPFMSQTSVGNSYVLLSMVVLGGFAAFQWKNVNQFFSVTSVFLFIFILTSQLSLLYSRGVQGSVFDDSLYDVSYFTLLLPYCLAYLSVYINSEKLMNNGHSTARRI